MSENGLTLAALDEMIDSIKTKWYGPEVTTSDHTDSLMWAEFLLSQTNQRSREIAPGIWQHTFTPGKRPYGMMAVTDQWLRRLKKYQRRRQWGLLHKKTHRSVR